MKLECSNCGQVPEELLQDAKAGDQCPFCFIPDKDCDGILEEPSSATPAEAREALETLHESLVDDAIEEWHQSTSPLALHEYLGWSRMEYGWWARGGPIPRLPKTLK